jgi:hypothetical protein
LGNVIKLRLTALYIPAQGNALCISESINNALKHRSAERSEAKGQHQKANY